jgi:hypothetical protein
MWKEPVVGYFMVQNRDCYGRTEEKARKTPWRPEYVSLFRATH